MNRRRFAAPISKPAGSPLPTLASRLHERVPLDVALSLANELLEAVASTHQQRKVFGGFGVGDVAMQPDGRLTVLCAAKAGDDLSLDTFAVGVVLYQVFTGLTPNQARARLAVSPLHAVPPASLINPALDDALDELLAGLLDKSPAARPHSLRVVQVVLEDLAELFDVALSSDAVVAWWGVPARPAAAPARRPRFALVEAANDAGDDEDEAPREDAKPARFDGWAVALCAFGVAAFALVSMA